MRDWACRSEIALARLRRFWFIGISLQQERSTFGILRVAKSALSGLLVVLLLGAAILSADPSHRQIIHSGTSNDNDLCVVCLLVGGQINMTEVAPILREFISNFVEVDFPATKRIFAAADYRISPSRAPPTNISSITVVG